MLIKLDDYLCHQTTDPLVTPATSDLRFFSRYFAEVYSKSGELALIAGFGRYPNTGVMDASALLSVQGAQQRNLRVSRLAGDDPETTTVGPIAFEVLEPLRSFRVSCDENPQGFTFDVTCETLTPPWERQPRFRPRVNGRVVEHTRHWNQGYRCQGEIVVDGEVHEVVPDSWLGIRDHSWGVGRFWDADFGPARIPLSEFGTYQADAPSREISVPGRGPSRGLYGNDEFPVGDRYVGQNNWVPFVEGPDPCYLGFSLRPLCTGGGIMYPWGDERPILRFLGVERRNVAFDDLGRFQACELVFTDEHDESHEMQVRRLTTLRSLACGYGDMGTGFVMGRPMGELHVEGERWDLTDPEHIASVGEHICEYRWGDRVGYGSICLADGQLRRKPYVKYSPPTASVGDEAGTQ